MFTFSDSGLEPKISELNAVAVIPRSYSAINSFVNAILSESP